MKIRPQTELSQKLAAEYALGTLRGGARRRFEQHVLADAALQAEVSQWQNRLQSLLELAPAVPPPADLWPKIAARLASAQAEQAPNVTPTATLNHTRPANKAPDARPIVSQPVDRPASQPGHAGNWLDKLWQTLDLWRGLALAGALASLVLAVLLAQQSGVPTATPTGQPKVDIAAVGITASQIALLSGEDGAPRVMVYWDDKAQQLRAKKLQAIGKQANQSLQLWAIEPGQAPRSMGLLDDDSQPGKMADSTASSVADQITFNGVTLAALDKAQVMAISVEPIGGSPQPTGPVILKGALIRL